MKVPYPIIFVLIGLLASALNVLPKELVPPATFMFVFLPPLLFEAAWNLKAQVLRENWVCIAILATIGVWISTGLSALIVSAAMPLSWMPALLFGAIVAATDPVSVVAVFRRLGLDERLIVILEGESLFNDGTAFVLFNIVAHAALTGSRISLAAAVGEFILSVAGGCAIGAGIGWLAEHLARTIKNNLFELFLTVCVAYLSFYIGELLHVSAVLSVVTAALLMGTWGKRDLEQKIWIEVDDFWTILALIVNSIVFLLIGLEARLAEMASSVGPVAIAVGSVLVSRVAVLVPAVAATSLVKKPLPINWQALIYWGGLRGALSMVLALSLPMSFAFRHELVVLTFGVVLFTLLVQGLTLLPLIRILKVNC